MKVETTDVSVIVRQPLRIDTLLDPCMIVACACLSLDRGLGGLDIWEEKRVLERRVIVQIRALEQHIVSNARLFPLKRPVVLNLT